MSGGKRQRAIKVKNKSYWFSIDVDGDFHEPCDLFIGSWWNEELSYSAQERTGVPSIF